MFNRTNTPMSPSHAALLIDRVRIDSLDLFRGLTILCMWWVNELHALKDVPAWLLHTQAHENGMGLADIVFPAFLFAVGMAIPLSERQQAGWLGIIGIVKRSTGLLVMGLFMVNAESAAPTLPALIPMPVWLLCSLICCYGFWGNLIFLKEQSQKIVRALSVLSLIFLAFIYPSANQTWLGMEIHWWGILGLTAWAYLFSAIIFIASRAKISSLVFAQVSCILISVLLTHRSEFNDAWLNFLRSQSVHFSHTAITLAGIICFQLIVKNEIPLKTRFTQMILWLALMGIGSIVLAPYFPVSKILATPSWVLLTSQILVVFYGALHHLTSNLLNKSHNFTRHLRNTSANALLAYLIPYLAYALLEIIGWAYPWKHQNFALGNLLIISAIILCTYLCSQLWMAKIRFKL